MTMIEQIIRTLCIPLAMGFFLVAAQASGGLLIRDTGLTQVAMK